MRLCDVKGCEATSPDVKPIRFGLDSESILYHVCQDQDLCKKHIKELQERLQNEVAAFMFGD